MKIIITEKANKRLVEKLVREEVNGLSDKVSLVKDFLDSNFLRASNSTIGDDGFPKLHDIVIWVDSFKQPKKYLDDTDLFYVLQDHFKDILPADDDEDDDESEEMQDDVNDIFNQALKDATKKIEKKVTHKNRDNFLKQCIKDWYYNKISKNGNLSLYENKDIDRWNYNQTAYQKYLKSRLVSEPNLACRNWDDNSIGGDRVIPKEINYLCDNLMKKKGGVTREGKKRKAVPLQVFICDFPGKSTDDDEPDLFHVMFKIMSNRATVKWFFICPNLTNKFSNNVNLVKQMLKPNGNQAPLADLSTKGILNSNIFSQPFSTFADRNNYLPFYKDLFLKYVKPLDTYENGQLKADIAKATSMTDDLNIRIEKYLNTVFPFVELPKKFNINQSDMFGDVNLDDISY